MDHDHDGGSDEGGERDSEQQQEFAASEAAGVAVASSQHTCSLYEPNYQQMHPLIYYGEEAACLHQQQHHHQHPHPHHHHLAGAHNQMAPANTHHPWDAEHFVHMPVMIPFGDTSSLGGAPRSQHSAIKEEEDGKEEEEAVTEAEAEEKDEEREPAAESLVAPWTLHEFEATGTTTPSYALTNRELHNEIERRRRSRIKHCCEALRTLVPGLSDKTDKASVLECTVKFVAHLVRDCPNSRCNCGG